MLEMQDQVPGVRLAGMPISAPARDLVPAGVAKVFACVPFALAGGRLSLAFTTPPSDRCVQVLQQHFRVEIDAYLCWPEEFESYTALLYGRRYVSEELANATSKAAA